MPIAPKEDSSGTGRPPIESEDKLLHLYDLGLLFLVLNRRQKNNYLILIFIG